LKPTDRVAFSPGEFAALFGKSQTWGYRQIYAGKVKTITEYGRILIPAAEVERILGKAGTYDGLKPKVKAKAPKKNKKVDTWRQFLDEQRKGKRLPTPKAPVAPASTLRSAVEGNPPKAALARLTRRQGENSGESQL
jgi:hypothetical protein